jgi:hypothetical protein
MIEEEKKREEAKMDLRWMKYQEQAESRQSLHKNLSKNPVKSLKGSPSPDYNQQQESASRLFSNSHATKWNPKKSQIEMFQFKPKLNKRTKKQVEEEALVAKEKKQNRLNLKLGMLEDGSGDSDSENDFFNHDKQLSTKDLLLLNGEGSRQGSNRRLNSSRRQLAMDLRGMSNKQLDLFNAIPEVDIGPDDLKKGKRSKKKKKKKKKKRTQAHSRKDGQ